MDIDSESLFGDHTRVRNFSDSEDGYDDDPDPEARRQVEASEGQDGQGDTNDGGEAKKIEPVKVKRVNANPQPKLDPQRLAGPRGMFHVQKLYKDVKWKGHGHEQEDLSILLKRLEHWAHRLYPKLPFQDTLDQIERLGMKKNVQVHMTKIRLDMVNEDGGNLGEEEDEVTRGPETEEPEPQVDVFDELIGDNFSSGRPTATQFFPMPTAPPASTPKPTPTGVYTAKPLTEEQRERLERNKRLAEEKRKARFLLQMEQKQAEAYAAKSKGVVADGIEEIENDSKEKDDKDAELESTDLSQKENKESIKESKIKELDGGMEVDEDESNKQNDVSPSPKKLSLETNENSSPEKTVKTYEKDKSTEDVNNDSGGKKGENERETENKSENVEAEKENEKDSKNYELESTDLSQRENEDSLEVTKTKESDDMEVDEVESDKQKDVSSLTKQSSQETEVETDNASKKFKEKTSDELSQKILTDSDSKKQHEGICTEEEMLALIDNDL